MRWNDLWIAIVILCSLTCGVLSLRGSELVLAAKTKAAAEKLNPTTEVVTVVVGDDGTNTTVVKTKPLLTGIPQIDYIHDPNLPRELKGHNLTNYPFYNAVPKDIEFECDGLHDGFYASVPHQCQLYHHCLFGTRYDFLCANYTAFDQKTFICHFVSEVDCVNSPKYFIRNEALYKQSETTTTTAKPPPTTTTTTTTVAPPTRKNAGRRRRPYRRRRPMYEYYYDEDAYDEEYYDDEEEEPPPRKSNRRQQRPSGKKEEHTTTTTTTTTQKPASNDAPLTRAPLSVYVPKVLPKIKRPVPLNEKSKYDYTTRAGTLVPTPTSDPKSEDDEEYYDEEYEDLPPPPPKKKDTGKSGRRRHQERKRPSRFDEEYDDEEEEEERPRMRKGNRKEDDFRPRSRGSMMKQRKNNRDEEPILSERPGFISRSGSRKRYEERRRKPEYEYYDDEEEEAESRYDDDDRRRPSRVKTQRPKPKKVTTTPTTTTTLRTTTTTTTTTTPSTTTYKTTKKTTTPAAEQEEDEEYEEYDYIEPPKFKPRQQEKPTTLAPHRFSTYRTTKVTTTEAPKKTQAAVTFRPRNKPDFKRTTAKPEMFSSQVGSPSGFKKQEEPKRTVDIPRRLQTQGLPLEDDVSYRRRPQEEEEEEIKKDSQLETYRKPYRPETTPAPERTEDFRRPPKYEYFQPTATGPELPRRNQKEEFKGKLENIPPTAPGSINRPFPAENPSVQVFRRPYFPSGPERRPSREESEDSRQSDVRTFSLPTAPENYKRPDGMPLTAAGYRRAARPKESKKPEEYYSRKPEEQGPNYRNPFSSRPVKEEPEYFKPKNVEFTAPGPSGESSTQRPLSYDIEEEYDVTLNDALQPSTLNPTMQYTRVKSRGYQSAVTHPSYRSLLLPSASQNYYSKTPLTSDEYEAVVLPAARFTQARYKQRRPNEWYW